MSSRIKAINFVKIVIAMSFIVYLCIFIVVKLIIDQYKEFQYFEFDINKKQFFSSPKVTPYLLSEKLLNRESVVIFGTSRSALIDHKMLGDSVINFSSSLYGNPIDVYHFLINLDKEKIKNINKIYYLIDYHAFGYKVSAYVNKVYINTGINKIYDSLKSFDVNSIKHAYKTVIMNLYSNGGYVLKGDGEVNHTTKKNFNLNNIGYPEPIRFSDEAFASLLKINDFSRDNNIEIVYFNVPLYNEFVKRFDMKLIIKQSKKIVNKIDSFYDLRCFPAISEFPNNFSSVNHPNYETTKYALDNLISTYKVNNNNIDLFYKNNWKICSGN